MTKEQKIIDMLETKISLLSPEYMLSEYDLGKRDGYIVAIEMIKCLFCRPTKD